MPDANWANYLFSKQPILSKPSYAFLMVDHKAGPNSQDILSSATAIMSECIENGITKLKSNFLCQIGKKCAKRKVKRYIENNLSVQAQVKRLTSKQL